MSTPTIIDYERMEHVPSLEVLRGPRFVIQRRGFDKFGRYGWHFVGWRRTEEEARAETKQAKIVDAGSHTDYRFKLVSNAETGEFDEE